MNIFQKVSLLILLLTWSILNVVASSKNDQKQQLRDDLEIVWPLIQTVKIEYELAVTQMEFYTNEDEKKIFLSEFENFIKEKYYDQILNLKLRQGKILLLLIDRELGKTPFELLKEFRTIKRAKFWQHFARLVGANLKNKYSRDKYPEIEELVLDLIVSAQK